MMWLYNYYGWQLPVLQLYNYLVFMENYNFGKRSVICKNHLIHTLLYRTIYRCIVIQKAVIIMSIHSNCVVTPL